MEKHGKYGEICGGDCYYGVPCPQHDSKAQTVKLKKKYLEDTPGTFKAKPRTGTTHGKPKYKKKHFNRNKPCQVYKP